MTIYLYYSQKRVDAWDKAATAFMTFGTKFPPAISQSHPTSVVCDKSSGAVYRFTEKFEERRVIGASFEGSIEEKNCVWFETPSGRNRSLRDELAALKPEEAQRVTRAYENFYDEPLIPAPCTVAGQARHLKLIYSATPQ